MILNRTILAGLAMLLLSIPLKGEISATIIDNAIVVSTDKKAVNGYKGCEIKNVEEVPAYVFELQRKKEGQQGTCSIKNVGRWLSVSKQNSTDGTALFENLPDGKYRVICYAGAAIGCEINGDTKELPSKSIVYEKEISHSININQPGKLQDKYQFNMAPGALKVFPNPTDDEINIHFENNDFENKVILSLINLLGQRIVLNSYLIDQNTNQYTWKINVSSYPPGAYFINLVDENGQSLNEKIIIQTPN